MIREIRMNDHRQNIDAYKPSVIFFLWSGLTSCSLAKECKYPRLIERIIDSS